MKRNITALLALFFSCLSTISVAQEYHQLDTSSQPLSDKVCATCHGAYGQGSPVVGGPSLAGLEPWYITRQLENFRAGLRGTQKDYIPGYEMQDSVDEISDAEIADIVAYIETWPVTQPEATITGDTQNGSQLYLACAACHGANAEGNEALGAPGLAGRNDWYMFRQIKLFQSGYRGGLPEDIYGRQMRAPAQALETDQDINDVLAFINQLQ